MSRILLTGATGFVGRHLGPALLEAGCGVRFASRNIEAARRRRPEVDWVHFDADDPNTFDAALEGCSSVVYLVHAMASGVGYAEREKRAAERMTAALERAAVRRVVYLGGVAPSGRASTHLSSRLETGELLRSGATPTVELRAGMIVGSGSTSWQIVRDLAERLPAMLLPKWLGNRSSPVSIDDVVRAIVASLDDRRVDPGCYELPGNEVISHRDLLDRVARLMGRRPTMIGVPILTPRLSSYWLALVTRADLRVAKELVLGLQADLVPKGRTIWEASDAGRPQPLDDAIRCALDDEQAGEEASGRRIASSLGLPTTRPSGPPERTIRFSD